MSNCRNPLHCIVPGFILKRMADSPSKEVRRFAIDNIGPLVRDTCRSQEGVEHAILRSNPFIRWEQIG